MVAIKYTILIYILTLVIHGKNNWAFVGKHLPFFIFKVSTEDSQPLGSIMKLSTRSRYGTRLMLDLAGYYGRGPVHLSEVAARQEISVKYLEQLIIPLKRQGLIQSLRGPKGGYILSRAPERITFAEIVRVLEGSSSMTECVDNPDACHKSKDCPTREVWIQATRSMYEQLESISLADKLSTGEQAQKEEQS